MSARDHASCVCLYFYSIKLKVFMLSYLLNFKIVFTSLTISVYLKTPWMEITYFLFSPPSLTHSSHSPSLCLPPLLPSLHFTLSHCLIQNSPSLPPHLPSPILSPPPSLSYVLNLTLITTLFLFLLLICFHNTLYLFQVFYYAKVIMHVFVFKCF